jgi:hypothetical protein
MAEKRTIDINIKNNADEATKDFNHFNDALDETAKSAKNVNSTFEEVYGELQPLTTRLGEAEDRLYELALAGDTTSKEYQELLTKVGEYRKVQIQTDLAVDGASKTMTQKLGSALNATTSGFAVTQGAMALFGKENEALEESLLKVQSALAIQQGVQGLTEAYKDLSIGTKLAGAAQAAFSFVTGGASTALKVFRGALISTGIGAIVVGLGLLIANFDKVKNALGGVTDKFKSAGAGVKFLMIPLIPLIAAIELAKKGLEALGIIESEEDKAREARHQSEIARIESENEARKRAFDARQKQFDREIALLEAEGKSTFELTQQKIQASIAIQKQEASALKTTIDLFETRAKALGQTTGILDDLRKQLEETNEAIKDQENELAINVINNNKKKADSYKQYVQDKKKADQEALDSEIDAEIELEKTFAEIKRANEDALRTEEENELLRVQEKYDVLEAMAYGNAEALEEIETARLNARNEILLKYDNQAYENKKALDDKADADEKERRAKQLENIKAYQEAEQAIRMANLDNAAAGVALLKDLAGENRKLQALGIAAENAVGIAKIIISTQAANAAAKLKYAAIPGGVALAAAEITANKISAGIGIAASVAAAAKGIASLKESASLDSGGDLGGDAGTEVIAPEFNVVGDSSVNQLAQLQQTPTQAFVVSGEVTSAQALDRNRVTNATL